MTERGSDRRPRAGARVHERIHRRNGRLRPGFDAFEARLMLSGGITFQLHDTYDTTGFFAANPRAMAVLQEAGQMLGSALRNSLAPIDPNPAAGDTWTAITFNPSHTGQNIDVSNLSVPASTLVVYVGGTTGVSWEGLGGPGGYTDNGSSSWLSTVAARGQAGAVASPPTGFGPWGGSVSFNTGTTWDFSGAPGSNFLGVALHELCHVLGIGAAGSWYAHVDTAGSVFTGPHAEASYGGPVPLDTGTGIELGHPQTHWAPGTASGGDVALMTPETGSGLVTPLDWAGLADIGWVTDQLAVSAQPPRAPTPTPTLSPRPSPTPPPVFVIGGEPVFRRRTSKKGKPVGKPLLSGFTLAFSGPLDPAAANDLGYYQVRTLATRKGKKGGRPQLRVIRAYSVAYSAGADSIEIIFAGPESFPTGGRVAVSSAVTGVPGAAAMVFAVSRGGKGIQPG